MEIWTDGACSGNPGPGGYAALLRYNGYEKEITGGAKETTNNKMELLGCIEALASLKRPMSVTVYADSAYLINAVTKGWLKNWVRKDWQGAQGPVKNQDLWQRLIPLLETHTVTFIKVKGHSGHIENERVDRLAVKARDSFKYS